ncbi:hypothetical protein AAF712_015733, partial [Marasmius tenuissimus]
MNLQPHLAITTHYLAWTSESDGGNLVLHTKLVAFRRLFGSHSGLNITPVILSVIEDIGCQHKIGMITLDNASNNDTIMTAAALELGEKNIPFDTSSNRIQCFPHIVNIAVKTGLKYLNSGYDLDEEALDHQYDHEESNLALCKATSYHEALKNNIVAAGRRIAMAIKASGQRRNKLQDTIQEGNKAGTWDQRVYLNLNRRRTWMSAIEKFLLEDDNLSHLTLSHVQVQVPRDIQTFLSLPHAVQEIASAEKMPTLVVVLPLYEQLISSMEDLKAELPLLEHTIQVSIDRLKEYPVKAWTNKVYILTMALNPMTKFKWIKENWSVEEYDMACSTVTAV